MRPFFSATLCLALCLPAIAQDVKESVPAAITTASPTLEAADKSYRSGKFFDASQQYQLLVKADSTSVPARVGLVRSYLKLQAVKPAFEAASAALSANPNAPELHSVMGDVQFRRGEMGPAEAEYRAALKADNRKISNFSALQGMVFLSSGTPIKFLIERDGHGRLPDVWCRRLRGGAREDDRVAGRRCAAGRFGGDDHP